MKVAVVMGSTSDWEVMKGACDVLDDFGVEYEKKVYSAHRTPAEFSEWVTSAKDRGISVIIAGQPVASFDKGGANRSQEVRQSSEESPPFFDRRFLKTL